VDFRDQPCRKEGSMIKKYGKSVRFAALGLATATALSFAAPAFAADAAAPEAAPIAKPAKTIASPALIAGIQAMSKRGTAVKPGVQEWRDGTLALTLDGSFLNVLVGQIQPDGTFSTFCATAPDAAKALSTSVAAAPAYEDK
jgi:hypothetical protein